MIYYTIKLGYYLIQQKKAWRIFFKKERKWDFGLVKFYQVISLLNYISKVIKKVVAKKHFQYCEDYLKLYLGQMRV